jgi:hypothetical protein
MPIRLASAALLLLTLAGPARGAVALDIDLAQLRAVPGAEAVAARVAAALPAEVRARLAMLESRFGFLPDRDLDRVVLTVPDAGRPTLRLVGLPAERIALALAEAAGAGAGGARSAQPMPSRPDVRFVAVAADQALLGRGAGLEAAAADLAALPPTPEGQAVAVRLVPGPAPRLAAMRLVRHGELRCDGAGSVHARVVTHDEAGAAELERRFEALRRMLAVGAGGGLDVAAAWAPVLAAARLTREGTTLDLALSVPEALRARAVDRLVDRLVRLGAG